MDSAGMEGTEYELVQTINSYSNELGDDKSACYLNMAFSGLVFFCLYLSVSSH